MPATEQTWRDSKLLHIVFGVTSVLMLLTTLWMLAADHQREWKDYQRKFRDVETRTADARIAQQENVKYKSDLDDFQKNLQVAREEIPSKQAVTDFEEAVSKEAADRNVKAPSFDRIHATYEKIEKAEPADRGKYRDELFGELNEFVRQAKFRENNLLATKKFKAADFDVARSRYELGVGEGKTDQELAGLQQDLDKIKQDVDKYTQDVQDAVAHRKALEKIVGDMQAKEAEARKDLDEQYGKVDRLVKARNEREDNYAKNILAMPIIDAFGRPLKVDQIWLPKLTINNNFRDVARFDRCTTCHQAIDKTAPGSAVDPGFREQKNLLAGEAPLMGTPEAAPVQEKDGADNQLLDATYGMQLANKGWLNDDDVTISVIRPDSLAAKGGLMVGDVILFIKDVRITDRELGFRYLLRNVQWGKPLRVSVRRGLPHPYVSHPRLDLFVGSLSPHKLQDIGCSICHDGQSSGTSFKWTSHTPNSPAQGDEWTRKHGWFNNHHWIFPMFPNRFAESSCLKCHHEVAELEPSERFPDPPAPKLVEGYTLIRQYGCFGCHEVNGYDGPNRRVGPDLRAEPNYAAAAQAILQDKGLSDQQREWAEAVVKQAENDAARRMLLESLRNTPVTNDDDKPQLTAATRKVTNVLDDVETPGKLRKVGPSLRHVASKVDYDFLYSWIRRPKDFRPTTKMPQFFGLHNHLEPGSNGLKASEKFEPIEIRGAVEYLLSKSQPFEFTDQPKDVTEEASADRGKALFETRGCLACHQHKDFPKAQMNQGPDLSHIGGKLDRAGNPDGGKWLYAWLRNPSEYHPRTLMPNLILDPLPGEGNKVSDPAADIATYLLASKGNEPQDIPSRKDLSEDEKLALQELAFDHLKDRFPRKQAEEYLRTGIPLSMRGEMKGDEVELLAKSPDQQKLSDQQKLVYVGRRTLSKFGCAGCHDIPGFEDSKPIGTGLADWGRKTADKLAFEQITHYLMNGHGMAHGASDSESAHDESAHDDHAHGEKKHGAAPAASHEAGEHAPNFIDMPPSEGYFMQALFGHQREGFIWQKLRAPRSFDYKKTENKGYNERLRMPKFNLNDEQREAIITFVLGLVAEPPAPQYVAKSTPRRQAIVEGMKVIEKFNCTGCHPFKMDRWELAYNPSDFSDPAQVVDYNFVRPHFSPQQIKASLEPDVRGLRHAMITGMPLMSDQTGQPLRYDEDGGPIEPDDNDTKAFYSFVLYDSTLINGQPRDAGIQNLLVPQASIEKQYPALGGYLPRLIYPAVVANERKNNPQVKADEAWGWLPPPLAGEGRKVQPNWLYDFLMNPFPIRPAVVLRMPRFNMSPAEASALVNYFAASDNAEYPYESDSRARSGQLSSKDADRLGDALKIITDNNYCVKCHLVGDFAPTGSDRAKGPHLDQVYKRLRGSYLMPWIANPKRVLPYTGMPVNIPPDKPVSQELYHGTSREQVEGLVDLLLNYDRYTESRTQIKGMVKPPPAAPPGAAAAEKPPSAAPADREQASAR